MGFAQLAPMKLYSSSLLLLLLLADVAPSGTRVNTGDSFNENRCWKQATCQRSPTPHLPLTNGGSNRYWVNFARSGDPNGPGLPSWPAFANAESKVQYLGDPIIVGGVANIHGLSAFDAVYTVVRGKPFAAR